MYALSCVEKFVADHPEHRGDSAVRILERARSCSFGGAIPASLIQSVLGDAILVDEFDRLVTSDPEYIRLVEEATWAQVEQPESP